MREFLRGNREGVLDLLPDVSGLLGLEHDEDAARFVLDAVEGHHVVVGLPVQLREVRLYDVVALLEKDLLLRVLYDRQGMTRSCSTWTTRNMLNLGHRPFFTFSGYFEHQICQLISVK